MTDLEELTVDYWCCAKPLRTGYVRPGQPLTGGLAIIARTSLIDVHRDAPTQRLGNCARELCLALGIVATPVERHDGGSAA